MICMTSTPTIPGAAPRHRLMSVFVLALLACVSTGCSKDPPTKDEFLSRADKAFAAQQLAEAAKDYREVLRLEPDNRVAQRQLGLIYFDQGQARDAYILLTKISELEPDN